MIATAVFYDAGRNCWAVEYDSRDDRQEHFATRFAAAERASAMGWVTPAVGGRRVARINIDLADEAQLERAVEEFLVALDDDVFITWPVAYRIVQRYLAALGEAPA